MLKLQNFSITDIFSNVDITFEEGKTYVVMGANGVGKSTLLHGIMGRPDLDTHGNVEFNGIDLTELKTDERAKLGIFIGFQAPTSIPGLSNFQFIRQANNIKAIDLKENLDKFRDISTQLGLPEEWDKRNLNTDASGGEKKKNELIQMLMLDTKIAMLDEPDSGLDVDGIKSLIEKLSTWKNENNTLVVVTHYEKLIDGLNPDAVVLLKKDSVQIGDKSLADKIFSSGFENV